MAINTLTSTASSIDIPYWWLDFGHAKERMTALGEQFLSSARLFIYWVRERFSKIHLWSRIHWRPKMTPATVALAGFLFGWALMPWVSAAEESSGPVCSPSPIAQAYSDSVKHQDWIWIKTFLRSLWEVKWTLWVKSTQKMVFRLSPQKKASFNTFANSLANALESQWTWYKVESGEWLNDLQRILQSAGLYKSFKLKNTDLNPWDIIYFQQKWNNIKIIVNRKWKEINAWTTERVTWNFWDWASQASFDLWVSWLDAQNASLKWWDLVVKVGVKDVKIWRIWADTAPAWVDSQVRSVIDRIQGDSKLSTSDVSQMTSAQIADWIKASYQTVEDRKPANQQWWALNTFTQWWINQLIEYLEIKWKIWHNHPLYHYRLPLDWTIWQEDKKAVKSLVPLLGSEWIKLRTKKWWSLLSDWAWNILAWVLEQLPKTSCEQVSAFEKRLTWINVNEVSATDFTARWWEFTTLMNEVNWAKLWQAGNDLNQSIEQKFWEFLWSVPNFSDVTLNNLKEKQAQADWYLSALNWFNVPDSFTGSKWSLSAKKVELEKIKKDLWQVAQINWWFSCLSDWANKQTKESIEWMNFNALNTFVLEFHDQVCKGYKTVKDSLSSITMQGDVCNSSDIQWVNENQFFSALQAWLNTNKEQAKTALCGIQTLAKAQLEVVAQQEADKVLAMFKSDKSIPMTRLLAILKTDKDFIKDATLNTNTNPAWTYSLMIRGNSVYLWSIPELSEHALNSSTFISKLKDWLRALVDVKPQQQGAVAPWWKLAPLAVVTWS